MSSTTSSNWPCSCGRSWDRRSPGSGGLRKARWSLSGRGKRGGIRVIYFWDERTETFYMLYAFPKSKREDLTPQQLRVLSQLAREEFG